MEDFPPEGADTLLGQQRLPEICCGDGVHLRSQALPQWKGPAGERVEETTMKKVGELVVVVVVVAVVLAFLHKREDSLAASPTASSTPAAASGKPRVTLKVVRRSPFLDDLIVTVRLTSPEPVVVAQRGGLPVTYLCLHVGNRGWDLVHSSLMDQGYPSRLPVHEFSNQKNETQDAEWEFLGRDMTWARREEVDSVFSNPLKLSVRVPYENKSFKPGDPPHERYKYATDQVEVPALEQ
jgi:hypothetical protein